MTVAKAGSAAAGRLTSRWWTLRSRLARTGRPGLVRFLAWVLPAGGALLVLQGVLLVWFLPALVPSSLEFESLFARGPWLQTGYWAAGVLLVIAGGSGALAGAVLKRRPETGTYLAVLLELFLLGTGVVHVYSGARFGAGSLLALGVVDIVSGLAVSVILSLCWYSLDPLGLRREASAEGARGRPA